MLVMAGILGCLGVILGATGKHALEGKVDEELAADLKPVSVIIKHTELHYLPLLYLACVSLVLGARNISLFRDGLSSLA